jgi:histidine triad (HIT) family protein
MEDCLFCRIARGETPARVVLEDDRAVAFRDIAPQAPVHVLVVPRAHISSLEEAQAADEGLLGHLLLLGAEVARREGIVDPGYRTVVNTGPGAGQSVFHIHVHILGGRPMRWPPG